MFLCPWWLQAKIQSSRFEDRSDWWSILNEGFASPETTPQEKESNDSNFQIAGVALTGHQFKQLTVKFGNATVVDRGDGSSSRHQVCYESAENPTPVHLLFELGEVEEMFYLFAGGSGWKGSDL